MKLKQRPDDFVVEEIPLRSWSAEKAPHAVYLMEKQGLDTFEAVKQLARKLRLPLPEIGYAGLKDKHAASLQYITLPVHCNIEKLKLPSLTLTRVGYQATKMQIGDLQGNRFTITARDVEASELSVALQRASSVPVDGVPNYFDSQRFGSVLGIGFIAKSLILKDYEAAVKQYLTGVMKSELLAIKSEKRYIQEHWGSLQDLFIRDRQLARVVNEYKATRDWIQTYKKIPAHLREMYVNAYQSFLWNDTVQALLAEIVEKENLYRVPYAAGSLFFYTRLSAEEKAVVPDSVCTLSETAAYDGRLASIVPRLLEREGIAQADLANVTAVGNFFKSRLRQTLVVPKAFTIAKPAADDLNKKPGRFKVTLRFELSKGSYATLVTKRLFGH